MIGHVRGCGDDEDEDVKKKALPFSPINTDFSAQT